MAKAAPCFPPRQEREIAHLAEEKAAMVGALSGALKRLATEKETAERGKRERGSARASSSDGREVQMAQMVSNEHRAMGNEQ